MFGRILIIAFAATALLWTVHVRASESARPQTIYVVQPGDTLWSIAAERYGGDPREAVWELQRANPSAGASLVPGQRLKVPR